jgi:hypothetical protein
VKVQISPQVGGGEIPHENLENLDIDARIPAFSA